MKNRKMIIEARVNEYAMRDGNPHIPWTPEEIAQAAVECREAGASILHFHGRMPDGSPDHRYETFRETVRLIRERTDLLIHPTLGAHARDDTAEHRLAHVVRLAEDGLAPDFAPLDMGTTNVDAFDAAAGRFLSGDKLYVNTTGTLSYFAETLRTLGIKPIPAVWSIPSLRLTDAFCRAGLLDGPLYLALGLSEGGMLATHPGTVKGIDAYLDFLPEGVRCEWHCALIGADMLPLIGPIAERGGHVAIGLGDHPYRALGLPTNADIIRKVAEIARAAGRGIATPDETRAMLGMPQPAAAGRVAEPAA